MRKRASNRDLPNHSHLFSGGSSLKQGRANDSFEQQRVLVNNRGQSNNYTAVLGKLRYVLSVNVDETRKIKSKLLKGLSSTV